MFYYQLELGCPSFLEQAEKILMEDLPEDGAALPNNDVTTPKWNMKKDTGGAGRGNKNEGIIISDQSRKKIMHRETERQRRQEMSGLYNSLRSLLPAQHIKGKRAVCDQMLEAVNHIKHLEANIKELEARREKLKKLSTQSSGIRSGNSDDGDGPIMSNSCSVKVNRCDDEMLEILISSSNADGFPMSRVLVELLGRGLDPLTLDSTRTNHMSLHKIRTRACDRVMTSIDLPGLQDRLTDIIKFMG